MNQTELGRHFGISAVAVGKKLSEFGLRNEQKEPSERARTEGYCHFAPMRDGTAFYLWNKEKVAALFRQSGMSQLSSQEVQARNTALDLIALAKEAEETGTDKLLYFFADEIPRREYPLIDRFLRELGSDMRLVGEKAKEGEAMSLSPPVPGRESAQCEHDIGEQKAE